MFGFCVTKFEFGLGSRIYWKNKKTRFSDAMNQERLWKKIWL